LLSLLDGLIGIIASRIDHLLAVIGKRSLLGGWFAIAGFFEGDSFDRKGDSIGGGGGRIAILMPDPTPLESSSRVYTHFSTLPGDFTVVFSVVGGKR